MLATGKAYLRRRLAAAGWEIRHIPRLDDQVSDNPYDALFKGGNLLRVPLQACTDKLGFNYGEWHPWSETAKQLIHRGGQLDYRSSVLHPFLEAWTFALIHDVFSNAIRDEKIRNHFLKIFHGYFLPFCNTTIAEVERQITAATRYLELDNQAAGHALSVDQSIHRDGTWTTPKGEIELERLRRLIQSIQRNGYQRSFRPDGDILGYALKRDNQFRYVIVSGLHRVAALSALGHQHILLRLRMDIVIGRDSVDSWPLVRQGIYKPECALAYFNHLFDFDSHEWASNSLNLEGSLS